VNAALQRVCGRHFGNFSDLILLNRFFGSYLSILLEGQQHCLR